jgi:hypothetical protein
MLAQEVQNLLACRRAAIIPISPRQPRNFKRTYFFFTKIRIRATLAWLAQEATDARVGDGCERRNARIF